jgi:hypothetical protein
MNTLLCLLKGCSPTILATLGAKALGILNTPKDPASVLTTTATDQWFELVSGVEGSIR